MVPCKLKGQRQGVIANTDTTGSGWTNPAKKKDVLAMAKRRYDLLQRDDANDNCIGFSVSPIN